MNMFARQRIKSPEYHHMICIGKTKCTSEKGLLQVHPKTILFDDVLRNRYIVLTKMSKSSLRLTGSESISVT